MATSRLSPEERAARGKAARARAPRSAHGEWEPPHDRAPLDVLREQETGRVPELLPVRHGRMLASPFAFFRGAAAIMAADLGGTPDSGIRVQLCGDAHVANFGGFASPDRDIVFDINDFDETAVGPWEWDLKRLAASIAVAGRDLGLTAPSRRAAVEAGMSAYRTALREFAALGNLEVWYARLGAEQVMAAAAKRVGRAGAKRVERGVAQARSRDHLRALSKLTERVDGELRIVSRPPLIVPVEELAGAGVEERMRALVRAYGRTLKSDRRHLLEGYEYVHAARKVVGVGSVGARVWVVLLMGRDGDDPLFLQVKEALPSVLERSDGRSTPRNHGRRVVQGQWLMQAASDIFLGWLRAAGPDGRERDFYVRQLWDWKASPDVDSMPPAGLRLYGELCGWTLARAHARSGDRIAIAAYLGRGDAFERALARFAEAYADQNERDHAALAAAAQSGAVAAEAGV